MNWKKLSPLVITLLIFLLSQGISGILLVIVGMLVSPEGKAGVHDLVTGNAQGLPISALPISLLAIFLIATNIFAVTACRLTLRDMRLPSALHVRHLCRRTTLLAVAASLTEGLSVSILTDAEQLPEALMQTQIALAHNFWGLVAIVLAGPVAEELIFREAIAGGMMRRGVKPWLAIILSATAFAAAHLNTAQGLYALPFGILTGIIYYQTGNVALTSLLHIINNGIVAAELLTLGPDATDTSYSELLGGQAQAHTVMLLLAALCILLVTLFVRHTPRSFPNTHKQPPT